MAHKKKSRLYCLSGLGTDQRAFQNFSLENIELIHVPWIDFLENESLESYAKRLFDVANPENGYNLIGLSIAISGNLTPLIAAILMPLSSITIVIFTTIMTNVLGKKLKE